jgi:hypothetical protein
VADWPADVREDLAVDVRRVADRVRGLSQAKLAAPAGPFASRADGAIEVAQALAEAGQGLADRESADEPAWRRVPRLSDFAVGDQVAVVGHDLLAALDSVAPDEEVWAPERPAARRTALSVVTAAADRLATLRRHL